MAKMHLKSTSGKMSKAELDELASFVREEYERRQQELRKTCRHERTGDIMYMRPGAYYHGCLDCQVSVPVAERLPNQWVQQGNSPS